jgi:protein ImuA
MTGARLSRLASLREAVGRIETRIENADAAPDSAARRAALGHAAIDAVLGGGLALGALHEVFAGDGRQGAAATGFALGLVRRVTQNRRFVLWIAQDFTARETGQLAMSGFAELGLDPRLIVVVRDINAETALRAASDGLGCNAFGAVVVELWGEPRAFDAVASRKLSFSATASGVTALMLRHGARPAVSTAETRWVVSAAPSRADTIRRPWGAPLLDAGLVRNRHGQTGRWLMQWNCDEYQFDEPAHSRPVAAAPADRPVQAAARTAQWRRRRA